MTASFMARYGERLTANGYPIIPIEPGTKRPGRFGRGRWSGYPDWSRHGLRATSEQELAVWSGWPDAGIGIVCGQVIGVDIDIDDDAALAQRIEALARERLGDTPALRIGKMPKRLLVYRAVEPFKGIKSTPIEILGAGQQFVAYAVHPQTNRPYDWPEESLANLDLASLPAIDENGARSFLDSAIDLVPAHKRPARLTATRSKAPDMALGGPLAGTLPAVRAALARIPNADLAYDDWVRIGLSVKGALGDAGADLFATWSAQSAKNDPAFTAKTWESLAPRSIGAGTLYHLAMERGWKPEPGLVLDGAAPSDEEHPARGLLDRLNAVTPAPKAVRFEIGNPGGILGEMVQYMVKTARRPQPVLALGASLAALGALMGRKYRTPTNLRSNLYIVGIADSGSGKNHPREVVNQLFVEAGLGHYLGGNKIASGAGLLTAVHRQPAILFQIDEFGMFLMAAADRKRNPRYLTEILDNLTELYTASGGIFLGAEYANRDGTNERRDINEPCVCLYGTTTPIHFWNALQSANVVDGSLARFIVIQTEDDYPEENLSAGIRSSPPPLLEALRLIADGGGIEPAGNLSGMTAGPETATIPRVVAFDSAAREVFAQLSSDTTNRLREARGTPFTSILARIVENASKVALIRAVSTDPVAPLIRADDAAWAIGFVRNFAERTIIQVKNNVSDNDIERNHKRVMETIRTAGRFGVTKNDLIRRTQFLDKRQRDDIICALIEAELVRTAMKPSVTKPALAYVALDMSST